MSDPTPDTLTSTDTPAPTDSVQAPDVVEPVDAQEPTDVTEPVDSQDPADAVDVTSDVAVDAVPSDVHTVSWCESVCANLKEGCPDGALGELNTSESLEACAATCEGTGASSCGDEWAAVQGCVSKDTAWECAEDGGVVPADESCLSELQAMGECLGEKTPSCEPNPCLNDGVCVESEDGTIGCECVDGFTGEFCDIAPEPLAPGDSCADPFIVDPASLPAIVNGDTGATDEDGKPLFTNTYTYCNGSAGDEEPDVVYAFTPNVTGTYSMALTSYEADPSTPGLLSVVTDCSVLLPDGAPSCLGGKNFSSGPDHIMVSLEAGTTYFLIVDSQSADAAGSFSLELGDVCVTWDPVKGCLDNQPPPEGGACLNDEDLAIVDEPAFQNTLQTCVMANFGDLSGVAGCLVADAGLSLPCAECWSDNTACMMQKCMICMTKPQSAGCLACADEFCNEAMFECAGINIGPEEPEGSVVINEIDAKQEGNGSGQFIEIFNAGESNVAMNGVYVVLLDGSTGDFYLEQNLAGLGTLEPGQYAVLAQSNYQGSALPGAMPVLTMQQKLKNGAGGVALVYGNPAVKAPTIWDTVSYGYNGNAEPFAKPGSWWTPEGAAPAESNKGSLSRCPNGGDTGDNAADFFGTSATPGLPNSCGGQLSSAQLCQSSGGKWTPESCGDYVCGIPPECDAVIPGCDCGEGQSFGPNGCYDDDACGQGGGIGDTHFVNIGDNYFDGDFISIKVGDTVEWTNQGNAPHTVTTDDGTLDSPSIIGGETWSHTFKEAGTFAYYCKLHANMTGTIVVE